jgi:hypothetical protein
MRKKGQRLTHLWGAQRGDGIATGTEELSLKVGGGLSIFRGHISGIISGSKALKPVNQLVGLFEVSGGGLGEAIYHQSESLFGYSQSVPSDPRAFRSRLSGLTYRLRFSDLLLRLLNKTSSRESNMIPFFTIISSSVMPVLYSNLLRLVLISALSTYHPGLCLTMWPSHFGS